MNFDVVVKMNRHLKGLCNPCMSVLLFFNSKGSMFVHCHLSRTLSLLQNRIYILSEINLFTVQPFSYIDYEPICKTARGILND